MNIADPENLKYRGRFAPSPSGMLHFGSLVAAVGSYLDARSHAGEWLIRIEDLDMQRNVTGAAEAILHTLEKLGMEWDSEVMYQSRRQHAYRSGLELLRQKGLIYACGCSRREIADSSILGPQGPIYPRTCLNKLAPEGKPHALRIRTNADRIAFDDLIQGTHAQSLEKEIGDFALRRADGIYAYQLAVVIDDAEQGITHIVRGADLLDSTPRQIYLQQQMGLITPQYMHLPVATNLRGEKLSKQTHAFPVDVTGAVSLLIKVLHFLGQQPPVSLLQGDIHSLWQWARQNWRRDRIPRATARCL